MTTHSVKILPGLYFRVKHAARIAKINKQHSTVKEDNHRQQKSPQGLRGAGFRDFIDWL
ncbi:hypothetical protein NNQ28_08835 [Cronobacter dublinensis]|uniref:hypothetical protein n=1 Tax=Cronobacter dublinensis TaxID=413497 RepID=UPI00292E0C57|nr:hypothetical protein [Cronobacter dublinensis]WNY84448.1 hypothetical protein NNQ28_08835 [Cronobacter dublinensis]